MGDFEKILLSHNCLSYLQYNDIPEHRLPIIEDPRCRASGFLASRPACDANPKAAAAKGSMAAALGAPFRVQGLGFRLQVISFFGGFEPDC